MKKILTITLLTLIHVVVSAQQDPAMKTNDVHAPTEGAAGSGGMGSMVNESNGKINLSYPIASIMARTVSYNVAFSYDGANVFKQATYTARHMATSALGVGWGISAPKIVADTKSTGSRDDDTFYLNGTKLVCINRPYTTSGQRIWEFKPNNNSRVIVKYYEVMFNPLQVGLDYWEVIDEKGYTYTYGSTDNSKESLLSWSNWIGDSKVAATAKHTIAWNLYSIKDQYNNNLTFTYLKVEQGNNTTGLKHTEASYLQQITSSTGEKIVFEYSDKMPYEYYEPHTEAAEPDAYQERYEKSYLYSVKTYNSSNELITNFDLVYDILNADISEKAKRYLTSIRKKNSNGNYLPADTFEYYLTGDFTGAIKKWTKPEGGSISYNYNKKLAFTNTYQAITNGYNHGGWASHSEDKYYVTLGGPTSPNMQNSGSDTGLFYLTWDSWNGRKWVRSKFDIPMEIRWTWVSGGWDQLDSARFIFGPDFFGVLVFDRGTHNGNVYLFHQLPDGTWNQFQHTYLNIGAISDSNHSEDPVLLNGDNFAAIGVKKSGDIYSYIWRGTYWEYKKITQGTGDYNYSANNNFILSVNRVTGVDMPVTMGTPDTGSHDDRFYFHFLDAAKINWQTRSWTSILTPILANISSESYFYPCNSMTSIVAGDNAEYFIRWDPSYVLQSSKVENITGSFADFQPLFPIGNNIYSAQHMNDPNNAFCYSFKQCAFTGAGWITQNAEIWSDRGFGQNRIAGSNNGPKVYTYNPNTSAWVATSIPFGVAPYIPGGTYAFGNELFIAGDHVFRINNWGFEQVLTLDPYYYARKDANSGGDYVYIHNDAIYDPGDIDNDGSTDDEVGDVSYYYVNKTNNYIITVVYKNFSENLYMSGSSNRRAEVFGGKYSNFSSATMRGTKLINNTHNQDIFDNVVSEVITDNGNGAVIKVKYTYSNTSHTAVDDATVFYDSVTITEVGSDTGSTNGYTIKYFENGSTDFTKAGLLYKKEIYNASNTKIADEIYTNTRSAGAITSTTGNALDAYYIWKNTSKVENSYVGGTITTTINYNYNNFGDLLYTEKANSEGVIESSTITYADSNYPFVANKNFRGFLYKKIDKVGTEVVAVQKINWVENGSNAYITENLSGVTEASLRVNSKIESVDAYGNVLQTSNGLGINKSVLMGYNYKYVVATVNNITHQELLSSLDVPYATLQTYNPVQLKVELLKLYDDFPNKMITLDLYDNYGRKILSVDNRKNETNYVYDEYSRLKYTTDKNGKILNINTYNYKNQ